jgi:hypothetical protein
VLHAEILAVSRGVFVQRLRRDGCGVPVWGGVQRVSVFGRGGAAFVELEVGEYPVFLFLVPDAVRLDRVELFLGQRHVQDLAQEV